jgi:hypothetical protein
MSRSHRLVASSGAGPALGRACAGGSSCRVRDDGRARHDRPATARRLHGRARRVAPRAEPGVTMTSRRSRSTNSSHCSRRRASAGAAGRARPDRVRARPHSRRHDPAAAPHRVPHRGAGARPRDAAGGRGQRRRHRRRRARSARGAGRRHARRAGLSRRRRAGRRRGRVAPRRVAHRLGHAGVEQGLRPPHRRPGTRAHHRRRDLAALAAGRPARGAVRRAQRRRAHRGLRPRRGVAARLRGRLARARHGRRIRRDRAVLQRPHAQPDRRAHADRPRPERRRGARWRHARVALAGHELELGSRRRRVLPSAGAPVRRAGVGAAGQAFGVGASRPPNSPRCCTRPAATSARSTCATSAATWWRTCRAACRWPATC